MQYTDNPVADHLAYEAAKEEELMALPYCDICGEPCLGDGYYEPESGVTVCEDCWDQYAHDNFWRWHNND